MSQFTLENAERAVQYLAETDQAMASAKALVEAKNEMRRITRAKEFLEATGTVGEREARAYASEAYQEAVNQWENSICDYELLRNKRKRAEITFEGFRSVNSAMKKGMII